MSQSKAKIPLDERSYEDGAKILLFYNIAIVNMINSQSIECLGNTEGSVDNCAILTQLKFSLLFSDDEEVNEFGKKIEVFKLKQRKRMLEEELNKLDQKEESSQSN